MRAADWRSLMFGVLSLILFRIHDLKEKGSDPQRIGIMVASHNEGTVRYAVQRYSIFIYPRRAPACYGSSLGSNPDISRKYKMGNISKGLAKTL